MIRQGLLVATLILASLAALAELVVPIDWGRLGTRSKPAAIAAGDRARALGRLDAALRPGAGQAVSRADDLTVLRRLHLALTGAIPSLEAIRAFEATPASPDRLDRVVVALLAERRTSDYLAERLARALVGVEDGPFLVFRRSRFVAWLADAIRRNRPYDQVVRTVVADSGLGTDHPATNFIALTYDETAKSYDPEAIASRVARAFLGVRLDCAKCHDHPFAAWRRADFQGLAAFFGQIEARASGVVDGSGEWVGDARSSHPGAAIAPRVPFAAGLLPDGGTRRERLAAWITDERNQHFRRSVVNRIWAILVGRPLVEPIDDIADADPGSIPPALDLLADDLAEHGFDLHRLIRLIAASAAFGLDSADQDQSSVERPVDPTEPFAWGRSFPITRLRPDQLASSVVQAGSTATIGEASNLLVRLIAAGSVRDFVGAHGDLGADEFAPSGPATIPQRLLMMNGGLVGDRVHGGIGTAAGRIALVAPDDDRAVEAAFLVALSRRPSSDEKRHFVARLAAESGPTREERLSDLFWVLVNTTEFATNH